MSAEDEDGGQRGACVKHRCASCHRIFDSVMNGTDCPHCPGSSVCSLPHSEGNCS